MTEVQVISLAKGNKVIETFRYKTEFQHNGITEIVAKGKMYIVVSKVVEFVKDRIIVKFYV